MNYRNAVLYLNGFINYEKVANYRYKDAYKLDRVKRLLRLLGDPQDRYPCVIIAGTKGKGSTAFMLASIFKSCGLKTALYTSPHLLSFRERIAIDGRPIGKREFASNIFFIKAVIEKSGLRNLTFFEILTASAFLYFARKRVDIAVLEVGLGGRLDATNTTEPLLSVITPISYDHMHLLGNTLEKIAREKAGVIREDSYVICSEQPEEALKVIKDVAQRRNAQLVRVGNDIRYKNLRVSLDGTIFDVYGPLLSCKGVKVGLIGRHQAINALTAVAAAEILKEKFGFDIKEKDLRSGLKAIKIPGRFQLISKQPYVILDGAHNNSSAQNLIGTTRSIFRKNRIFLILGISADKDIEAIGKILCPNTEAVIFTTAASPRACEPRALASKLESLCKECYVSYDINDALKFAKGLCNREDIILVTGSLFLIADALKP